MINFLTKLFIKDHNNIQDPNVRRKHGNFASIFGIISNLFVCSFKIIFGLIFNLISLIADGINNLTDAGSSIVSLIGFKLSSKPADKDHPFGHARIEYIAGFIVSILICILGIQLITNSISDIVDNFFVEYQKPNLTEFIITITLLIIAIIIKIFQGLVYHSIGKKINSTTLKATALDSRKDVISSAAVLVGFIISYIFNFYTDGYLGFLVGLFILYSGFKLIKETSDPLIGEKIDPELVKKFLCTINSYQDILGTHDLQIHAYGPDTYYASIHVEVDASKDILSTHDLIDNIEKELYFKFKIITTIHMDPVVLNDPYTDEVKNLVIPEIEKLPYIQNVHDFRVVKGPTHTNIIFDIVVKHETKHTDEQIKKEVKSLIANINETFNSVITIDHDYMCIDE